ncbi:hypothetical protein GCM10020255_059340 [Rhodococcus baikonurensis]
MSRVVQNICGTAGFDDSAALHDQDPVRTICGHSQVVRDQEHGGTGFGDPLVEMVENASLNRDVESTGRLVGDDEGRVRDKRDADQNSLPHTAGQLVWVLACSDLRSVDTRALEHLDGVQPCFATVGEAVDPQDFGDLVTDPRHRVERSRRILRHQTDTRAADSLPRTVGVRVDSFAFELDGPAGDVTAAGEQTQYRVGRGRLTRTRFPDHRNYFTTADCEAHAGYRGLVAVGDL